MLYLKLQNGNSRSLENAIIKVAKLFSLEPPCNSPFPRGFLCGCVCIWVGTRRPSRLQRIWSFPFRFSCPTNCHDRLSWNPHLLSAPSFPKSTFDALGQAFPFPLPPPSESQPATASRCLLPSTLFPVTTELVGEVPLYPKPSLS